MVDLIGRREKWRMKQVVVVVVIRERPPGMSSRGQYFKKRWVWIIVIRLEQLHVRIFEDFRDKGTSDLVFGRRCLTLSSIAGGFSERS